MLGCSAEADVKELVVPQLMYAATPLRLTLKWMLMKCCAVAWLIPHGLACESRLIGLLSRHLVSTMVGGITIKLAHTGVGQ